jgi:hypothetical protein
VQDLKRRRFDGWKRYESIKLVRDYITCVDELTLIVDLYAKKLDFLSRLRKDCELFEFQEKEAPNNDRGKPTLVRIDWAIGVIEEAFVLLDSMLKDLKISMSAVSLAFQSQYMGNKLTCNSSSNSDQSSRTNLPLWPTPRTKLF